MTSNVSFSSFPYLLSSLHLSSSFLPSFLLFPFPIVFPSFLYLSLLLLLLLQDIHELCISKDEFERREAQHEAIYTDYIHNRKPGDGSHYGNDDHYLNQLVKEETKRENFTAVVCQGVHDYHITDLKNSFRRLCTQLAHIYHYYIHGPDGNTMKEESASANRPSTPSLQPLTIRVRMQTKSKVVETVDLRSVDYDHQTNCIRSASSTFKFKAVIDGVGDCEGELRWDYDDALDCFSCFIALQME